MKRKVRLNLFKKDDPYLEILSQLFKEANPELVALSPKIEVDKVTHFYSSDENTTPDTPWIEITISHPFLFDNRQVPNEFNGIKVNNVTTGKFPKEFPNPETDIPLAEYYNPERYIKYVNRNLSLIRRKLKIPKMSKEEALDALTGGFKDHVKWCNKLSQKDNPKHETS